MMPCVDSDRDRAAISATVLGIPSAALEERAGDSSSSDELPSISASETRTTPGGGDDWDMYRGGERDLMMWTSSSSSSSFSSSSSVEHCGPGIALVFSLFVFSSCVTSEPEVPPFPSIHMIERRRRGGLESSTASASSGPPSNTMLLVIHVNKEDFTKTMRWLSCVNVAREEGQPDGVEKFRQKFVEKLLLNLLHFAFRVLSVRRMRMRMRMLCGCGNPIEERLPTYF